MLLDYHQFVSVPIGAPAGRFSLEASSANVPAGGEVFFNLGYVIFGGVPIPVSPFDDPDYSTEVSTTPRTSTEVSTTP